MSLSRGGLVLICALLVLTVLACGSLSPPESCGEGVGGTADEGVFAEHFSLMELVDEATGQPGPEGEEGPRFASTAALSLAMESLSEASMQICVQERRGGGKVAFNQSLTVPSGAGAAALGTFDPGNYVIRVIVDGILVRNFPFVIE